MRLLEPFRHGVPRRALVTILDQRPADQPSESALLSEAELAEDWNRPEEDEAWKHLPKVRSFFVRFPFSDLWQTKLRSGVVLADAGRGDRVLRQITSTPPRWKR